MDSLPSPVDRLVMEDLSPGMGRRVTRAPEDAAWVGVFRSEVAVDDPVVRAKGGAVVIPVHGHGEGITDGQSEEGAAVAGGEWRRWYHVHLRTTLGRRDWAVAAEEWDENDPSPGGFVVSMHRTPRLRGDLGLNSSGEI